MEYLLKKTNPKLAHIFVNGDTCCRLYSTGGMSQNKYKRSSKTDSLPLCHLCNEVLIASKDKRIYDRLSHQKQLMARHLAFSETV